MLRHSKLSQADATRTSRHAANRMIGTLTLLWAVALSLGSVRSTRAQTSAGIDVVRARVELAQLREWLEAPLRREAQRVVAWFEEVCPPPVGGECDAQNPCNEADAGEICLDGYCTRPLSDVVCDKATIERALGAPRIIRRTVNRLFDASSLAAVDSFFKSKPDLSEQERDDIKRLAQAMQLLTLTRKGDTETSRRALGIVTDNVGFYVLDKRRDALDRNWQKAFDEARNALKSAGDPVEAVAELARLMTDYESRTMKAIKAALDDETAVLWGTNIDGAERSLTREWWKKVARQPEKKPEKKPEEEAPLPEPPFPEPVLAALDSEFKSLDRLAKALGSSWSEDDTGPLAEALTNLHLAIRSSKQARHSRPYDPADIVERLRSQFVVPADDEIDIIKALRELSDPAAAAQSPGLKLQLCELRPGELCGPGLAQDVTPTQLMNRLAAIERLLDQAQHERELCTDLQVVPTQPNDPTSKLCWRPTKLTRTGLELEAVVVGPPPTSTADGMAGRFRVALGLTRKASIESIATLSELAPTDAFGLLKQAIEGPIELARSDLTKELVTSLYPGLMPYQAALTSLKIANGRVEWHFGPGRCLVGVQGGSTSCRPLLGPQGTNELEILKAIGALDHAPPEFKVDGSAIDVSVDSAGRVRARLRLQNGSNRWCANLDGSDPKTSLFQWPDDALRIKAAAERPSPPFRIVRVRAPTESDPCEELKGEWGYELELDFDGRPITLATATVAATGSDVKITWSKLGRQAIAPGLELLFDPQGKLALEVEDPIKLKLNFSSMTADGGFVFQGDEIGKKLQPHLRKYGRLSAIEALRLEKDGSLKVVDNRGEARTLEQFLASATPTRESDAGSLCDQTVALDGVEVDCRDSASGDSLQVTFWDTCTLVLERTDDGSWSPRAKNPKRCSLKKLDLGPDVDEINSSVLEEIEVLPPPGGGGTWPAGLRLTFTGKLKIGDKSEDLSVRVKIFRSGIETESLSMGEKLVEKPLSAFGEALKQLAADQVQQALDDANSAMAKAAAAIEDKLKSFGLHVTRNGHLWSLDYQRDGLSWLELSNVVFDGKMLDFSRAKISSGGLESALRTSLGQSEHLKVDRVVPSINKDSVTIEVRTRFEPEGIELGRPTFTLTISNKEVKLDGKANPSDPVTVVFSAIQRELRQLDKFETEIGDTEVTVDTKKLKFDTTGLTLPVTVLISKEDNLTAEGTFVFPFGGGLPRLDINIEKNITDNVLRKVGGLISDILSEAGLVRLPKCERTELNPPKSLRQFNPSVSFSGCTFPLDVPGGELGLRFTIPDFTISPSGVRFTTPSQLTVEVTAPILIPAPILLYLTRAHVTLRKTNLEIGGTIVPFDPKMKYIIKLDGAAIAQWRKSERKKKPVFDLELKTTADLILLTFFTIGGSEQVIKIDDEKKELFYSGKMYLGGPIKRVIDATLVTDATAGPKNIGMKLSGKARVFSHELASLSGKVVVLKDGKIDGTLELSAEADILGSPKAKVTFDSGPKFTSPSLAVEVKFKIEGFSLADASLKISEHGTRLAAKVLGFKIEIIVPALDKLPEALGNLMKELLNPANLFNGLSNILSGKIVVNLVPGGDREKQKKKLQDAGKPSEDKKPPPKAEDVNKEAKTNKAVKPYKADDSDKEGQITIKPGILPAGTVRYRLKKLDDARLDLESSVGNQPFAKLFQVPRTVDGVEQFDRQSSLGRTLVMGREPAMYAHVLDAVGGVVYVFGAAGPDADARAVRFQLDTIKRNEGRVTLETFHQMTPTQSSARAWQAALSRMGATAAADAKTAIEDMFVVDDGSLYAVGVRYLGHYLYTVEVAEPSGSMRSVLVERGHLAADLAASKLAGCLAKAGKEGKPGIVYISGDASNLDCSSREVAEWRPCEWPHCGRGRELPRPKPGPIEGRDPRFKDTWPVAEVGEGVTMRGPAREQETFDIFAVRGDEIGACGLKPLETDFESGLPKGGTKIAASCERIDYTVLRNDKCWFVVRGKDEGSRAEAVVPTEWCTNVSIENGRWQRLHYLAQNLAAWRGEASQGTTREIKDENGIFTVSMGEDRLWVFEPGPGAFAHVRASKATLERLITDGSWREAAMKVFLEVFQEGGGLTRVLELVHKDGIKALLFSIRTSGDPKVWLVYGSPSEKPLDLDTNETTDIGLAKIKSTVEALWKKEPQAVTTPSYVGFRNDFIHWEIPPAGKTIMQPYVEEKPKPKPPPGDDYVVIKAGRFKMRSPTSEEFRGDDEVEHEVRITRDFYLKKTEVTQREWKALTQGTNPSFYINDDAPVERVDWYSAVAYLNALSIKENLTPCYTLEECAEENGWYDGRHSKCRGVTFAGLSCNGYRLPTEAEWEYAARAGTTGPTYESELEAIAWYMDNSNRRTQSVKQKKPNVWGLYDMLGNVWEWVHDWYGPYAGTTAKDPLGLVAGKVAERVLRGGDCDALWVRVAERGRSKPDRLWEDEMFGFRPARSRLDP